MHNNKNVQTSWCCAWTNSLTDSLLACFLLLDRYKLHMKYPIRNISFHIISNFLPQFAYNVNWGCPITLLTRNRRLWTLFLKCCSYILRRIKTKLGEKLPWVVLQVNRALLSDSMIFRFFTAFQT